MVPVLLTAQPRRLGFPVLDTTSFVFQWSKGP